MRTLTCPITVGREATHAALDDSLSLAAQGRGGVVFLTGGAGSGKSRLARELGARAARDDVLVLTGRATAVGESLPFRAVSEAFTAAFRSSPPPMPPELDAYGAALRVVLPDWVAGPETGPVSTLSVFEAVVRLLRLLAGRQTVLLVLEDLQWASSETVSIVEYLADNLDGERVLCLCTAREHPLSTATALAERLTIARSALHLRLGPLAPAEVERMTQLCLDEDRLPWELLDYLHRRGGGNPYAIEELLADALESGALVERGRSWCVARPLPDTVPAGVLQLLRERLAVVDQRVRGALNVVAALGPDVPDEVLAPVAQLDVEEAHDALHQLVKAGLLRADSAGLIARLEFAHPLGQPAVLTELLPCERTALAERALAVIEAAPPAVVGQLNEQAAQLCEWTGKHQEAARYLLHAAQKTFAAGALADAEGLLDRARALVDSDDALPVELDELRVAVLAAAGKATQAIELGEALVQTLTADGASPARVAGARLAIASGWLLSRDWQDAETELDQARLLAVEAGDRDALARVDVTAAALASRQERITDAVALAQGALAIAKERGLHDVASAALRVTGTDALAHDVEQAERTLAQARQAADRHGLTLASIGAGVELGAISAATSLELQELQTARLRAEQAGAVADAIRADLCLGWGHLLRAEPDPAFDSLERCLAGSRRWGLRLFGPALATLASFHAVYGEHALVDELVEQALAAGPDDPTTAAIAWGDARAVRSLVQEERADCLRELRIADEFVHRLRVPTPSWFSGLWALLLAIEGNDDAQARPALEASGYGWVSWRRGFLALADAVELGRTGRKADAEKALAAGDAALAPARLCRHYGLRLVAEAAIEDEWGEPVGWLRESLAFFEEVGHHATVAACKRLLQEAGAAVPGRGRGNAVVPPGLRSLGITSREMDVLHLLVEGRSTAEMATKLFLSPRTVKTHVASLMHKTGTSSRQQLVAFAAEHNVDASDGDGVDLVDLVERPPSHSVAGGVGELTTRAIHQRG